MRGVPILPPVRWPRYLAMGVACQGESGANSRLPSCIIAHVQGVKGSMRRECWARVGRPASRLLLARHADKGDPQQRRNLQADNIEWHTASQGIFAEQAEQQSLILRRCGKNANLQPHTSCFACPSHLQPVHWLGHMTPNTLCAILLKHACTCTPPQHLPHQHQRLPSRSPRPKPRHQADSHPALTRPDLRRTSNHTHRPVRTPTTTMTPAATMPLTPAELSPEPSRHSPAQDWRHCWGAFNLPEGLAESVDSRVTPHEDSPWAWRAACIPGGLCGCVLWQGRRGKGEGTGWERMRGEERTVEREGGEGEASK